MRLPQFSLKTLAGIVAFAAIGCCSLVYASRAWSATIYTAAIVFLAFATLAAVYNRDRARAFWVGCAVFGWLYLALVLGPLSGTQQMTSPGQLNIDSELATMHLARWLYGAVLPKLRKPPEVAKTVGLEFTLSRAGTVAEGGMSGSITEYADLKIAGRPIATSPAAAPNYPDETSFIRVSHALWTWLFALAGGIAGRWLRSRSPS